MEELVIEFQIIFGILALLGAYLVGSLNTARILVLLTGNKGILETGTGNAGANNVRRVFAVRYSEKYGERKGKLIGRAAGIGVLLIDIGKGALIVYLARNIFGFPESITLLYGIITMAGHNWPLFWKLRKGGKGIAILGGILLALHPLSALFALIPALAFLFIDKALPSMKQSSGFVPFAAIPAYVIANSIFQQAGGANLDLGALAPESIGVLFVTLPLIYLRRVDAEWLILEKQPSKLKALWYLLIYDRSTNDPPPL